MKKLFIVMAVFLMSCEKDNKTPNQPSQPATCDCYEQYEEMGAGGVWYQTYNTTAQPDLCAKETGDYLYPTMMTRYKVICN